MNDILFIYFLFVLIVFKHSVGWYFHHWCVCADPCCLSVAFLQAFIVQDTFIWSFVFLFLVSSVLCGIYNLLKTFPFFCWRFLIWRAELPCVYHYGCISQGAKSKYHKHLLSPRRNLRTFLSKENSRWGSTLTSKKRDRKYFLIRRLHKISTGKGSSHWICWCFKSVNGFVI